MLPSRTHSIVLVSKLHMPTLRAVNYARATRPDTLEAVTVNVDEADTRKLVREWEQSDITVPLKVIESPYREVTKPILDYVKRIRKDAPRDVVTVFIPEYVVGHWWEQVLHNQSALRLKGRLLFEPGVMVTSVPWQLNSSERAKRADWAAAPGDVRRGYTDPEVNAMADGWVGQSFEITLGKPGHGGFCVGRHDGRVVFVRHGLPGEVVRAQVTEDRGGGFCRADATEVLTASPDRVPSVCPVSGPGGAGCCDYAHASLPAQRAMKAAVLAEQMQRIAGLDLEIDVEELPGTGDGTGWRTRTRFVVGTDGRAGVHRYRSTDVIADLRCPQPVPGATADLAAGRWPPGSELVVAVDGAG